VQVVGSLTTVPSRLASYDKGLDKTLQMLLSIKQLDVIYLNIPHVYAVRTTSSASLLPPKLTELCEKSNKRLQILRPLIDYGPATKLLPTLLLPASQLNPDSMIITFDDDRLYTPEAIAALVKHASLHKDAVITIAAWSVTIFSASGKRGKPNSNINFKSVIPPGTEGLQYKKAGPVDLILGFYGVLYRQRFFFASPSSTQISKELFDFNATAEFATSCAWVDDVWFSGHLERLKVPRFTIGNVPETRADITSLSNIAGLSLDQGESVKQNNDNVVCAEAMRKAYGIWKL